MIRLGGSLDRIPWEIWGSSTQTQPLGSPWKGPEPVRDRSEAKVITSVRPVNDNDTNQRKSKPAASWVNCRGNVLKMTVWAFGQGMAHVIQCPNEGRGSSNLAARKPGNGRGEEFSSGPPRHLEALSRPTAVFWLLKRSLYQQHFGGSMPTSRSSQVRSVWQPWRCCVHI